MKEIEKKAFENTGLTEAALPDSLETIGNYAFSSCTKLNSVTFGNKLTEIGEYAFKDTVITTIKLPDSLVNIGEKSFASCTKLNSVTFGNKLTKIGNYAFKDTVITTIKLPDSLVNIGPFSFSSCTKLESITFPSKLEVIGGYAFEKCESLTEINLPKSVKIIGMYAFASCPNLKSVTIPSTVTEIDDYAFGYQYNEKTYETTAYSDFMMYLYGYGKDDVEGKRYADENGFEYKWLDKPKGLVKGDLNDDDKVNVSDISILAAHIKGIKAMDAETVAVADFNGDGVVNVTDLSKLAAHVKGIKPIDAVDPKPTPKPEPTPEPEPTPTPGQGSSGGMSAIDKALFDYTVKQLDKDLDSFNKSLSESTNGHSYIVRKGLNNDSEYEIVIMWDNAQEQSTLAKPVYLDLINNTYSKHNKSIYGLFSTINRKDMVVLTTFVTPMTENGKYNPQKTFAQIKNGEVVFNLFS